VTADDAVAIPEGDRPRLPRLGLVALAALAIGLGAMATTYSANHITDPRHDTDLLLYFLPAAAGITPDHPFQIYAVRAGEYPNFLPPLPIVAMAAVLEAARAVHLPGVQTCVAAGFNDLACRPLVAAVALAFLPFVPALAWLVAWLVRRLRPTASAGDLLLAFGLVAVSPLAWQDFTKWWHVEQPLMLLFLLGGVALLLRSRPLAGGVLLGLALLTRLTALVPIVTLGVAALTATVPGARRRPGGPSGGPLGRSPSARLRRASRWERVPSTW